MRIRYTLVLFFAIVVSQPSSSLHAQSPPPVEPVPVTTADAAAGESKPADNADDVVRKRKLRLAILVGGLIAVTGLAMVALTILGGSATRRGLRRKPLTQPSPPSEPIPASRFDEPEPKAPGEDPNRPRGEAGETVS